MLDVRIDVAMAKQSFTTGGVGRERESKKDRRRGESKERGRGLREMSLAKAIVPRENAWPPSKQRAWETWQMPRPGRGLARLGSICLPGACPDF